MDNRLYIIVRDDLKSVGSMAVQSGHAVAQYMLENDDWKNEYLIFLKASPYELEKLEYKLKLKNIKYSQFNEPDLDNQRTAIAVLNNSKLFRKFELL